MFLRAPSAPRLSFSQRNWQKRTVRFICDTLIVTALFGGSHLARGATTLIWDSAPGTGGIQEGNSTSGMPWATSGSTNYWWNGASNVNWIESTSGSPIFAQFGNGGTAATKTVTVSGIVTVAGLSFGAISGGAGAGNPAYTLTAGTINVVGDGVNSGTITVAETASSSATFLNLNSALSGDNITILRAAGGTTEQYVQLGGSNTWGGKLTLAAGNGGIFFRTTGSAALNTLTSVDVNSGTTLTLQSAGATYASNFIVSGMGSGIPRGVMRFDNDMTLSGTKSTDGSTAMTLAGNATLNFQNSSAVGTNVTFTGRITESAAGSEFTKTGAGTLTLRAGSNYTGRTIVGPSASGSVGGTLLLDFANGNVSDNLLYSGVTAAGLQLSGTASRTVAASTATLAITGKAGVTNNQIFNGLTVSGPTALNLTSGASGGAVNLTLGDITRTGAGATLAISGPASGSVTTTTNVGTLLGTWAFYNAAGTTTWAASNGSGVLGNFTGDTEYPASGGNLSSLPSTANLNISSNSTGAVTQTGAATINTISMTDATANRVIDVGAGNTLTLGTNGGIQLVAGAKNLTIGSAVNTGTLRVTGVSELALSNLDASSVLTINSIIADNGGNALTLVSNGVGKTVLTGGNTYTGATLIYSGTVEVRGGGTLGTVAGSTSVAGGAALQLSEGAATGTEAISLNGTGIGGTGAIRSVSGSNTIGGVVTLATDGVRINADAGSTLTLFRTSAATNMILGTGFNVTFGGEGTISVGSVIATSTGGTVTKADSSTLILGGANSYTGATTIGGGVLRITNAAGLGTAAGGTTVSAGAALELSSASTMTTNAEALTLNGTGVNNGGALRNVGGNNTFAGAITLGTASRINSDSGTLTLDVSSGSAITGTAVGVTFGGAGNIAINDALALGTGGVAKDGAGTLTFNAANSYTGMTTISNGTLALGASEVINNAGNVTVNGGTLALGAFSETVAAVNLTSGSITGSTGVLTGSSYTVQSGSVSAILGGAGALTKNGSGTVTLSGANTYSGATSFGGGRLVLDYSGGATVVPTTNALQWAGGTLEIKGSGSATNVTVGAITSVNTTGTGLSTLVIGSNVAVTGDSLARGSGTFLLIDLSATGSSLKFNTAPTVISGQVTAAAGGNASILIKDSNGRYDFAALGAGNTIKRLASTTALPTAGSIATSALIAANGGTVSLTGDVSGTSLRIDTTANSGTLDLAGSTLSLSLLGIVVDGSNDFLIKNSNASAGALGASAASGVFIYQYGTGKVTLDAKIGSTQTFLMGSGLIDWTGAPGNSGANLIYGATVRLSGTGLSLSSAGSGNGSGSLGIGNGGILELNSGDFTRALGGGTNQFRFVLDGGFSAYGTKRIVNLGNAGATLTWGSTGSFLASGSKLILGSQFADATVDFRNGLNLNGATQTIEVQSQNTAGRGGEVSGNISGAAGSNLVKTGQGILTLSGASTYAGSTTVAEGTMVVTGSISGGTSINVAGGAEFGVSGSGAVSGQTLSLGNTAKLSLEVGTTTSTTISLTGAANLTGLIALNLTLTADPLDGTLFTLIDGGSAVTGGGLFAIGSTTLTEGSRFNVTTGAFTQDFIISYAGGGDGGNVTLLAVVPEPATGSILGLSSGLMLGLRRWRRRAGARVA